MSANDKANAFGEGMKQEYDRIAQGLKEGGPDPNHQRQGENTEGLINRYGPGGSAFSTTDNASQGASNLLDSAKQATGLGQSNTEKATQSVSDGAKSFGQGAKEEFNAISSGPSSGATTGESVLESLKSATGFGQTRTEQAGQSVSDGAKSFGQGAKEEFNAISSGPSSGASTGDSVLESVKSATGFGQTRTEQAGQTVSDGAKSFGQGAKEEFNAITSSGPSSGATTGESLLESVKSATGFGQTRTEQAGQSVADGAKSFGQGAKDELNAMSSGPSSGATTGDSLLEQVKSATGFGQSQTQQAGQGAADELRAFASGPNSGTAATTTGGGHTTADTLVNQAADSQRLV